MSVLFGMNCCTFDPTLDSFSAEGTFLYEQLNMYPESLIVLVLVTRLCRWNFPFDIQHWVAGCRCWYLVVMTVLFQTNRWNVIAVAFARFAARSDMIYVRKSMPNAEIIYSLFERHTHTHTAAPVTKFVLARTTHSNLSPEALVGSMLWLLLFAGAYSSAKTLWAHHQRRSATSLRNIHYLFS